MIENLTHFLAAVACQKLAIVINSKVGSKLFEVFRKRINASWFGRDRRQLRKKVGPVRELRRIVWVHGSMAQILQRFCKLDRKDQKYSQIYRKPSIKQNVFNKRVYK